MPIYEYKCSECSHIFEEIVSSVDKATAFCERCGKEAHRLVSKTSFQLKGDGWYVTEYGNKAQSSVATAGGDISSDVVVQSNDSSVGTTENAPPSDATQVVSSSREST